jgi:hypothetical protein
MGELFECGSWELFDVDCSTLRIFRPPWDRVVSGKEAKTKAIGRFLDGHGPSEHVDEVLELRLVPALVVGAG